MRTLSPSARKLVDDIGRREGFGFDATLTLLEAVAEGRGSMAQFSHPELGGHGQWMRGGMTMLSDLSDAGLKSRIDALCEDLAQALAADPDLLHDDHPVFATGHGAALAPHHGDDPAGAKQHGGGSERLFVTAAAHRESGWWPAGLGSPSSSGSQNLTRYAVFADARRLAVDDGGRVTVYDTGDHRIGSVSQQQSGAGSLTFTSQHGAIDIAGLPVVRPA